MGAPVVHGRLFLLENCCTRQGVEVLLSQSEVTSLISQGVNEESNYPAV